MNFSFEVIAHIESDFPQKFGIPRQSGILKSLKSTIVFEDAFRSCDALRGLEDFSHLWILWVFSENVRAHWKPTVRPPRLGGNKRLGVFATRSSFRPNPIAMSCVKIEAIDFEKARIIVSGADLMDKTPILDIKPYLPYADKIENASGGFTDKTNYQVLDVDFDEILLKKIPGDKREGLLKILEQDPRPHYHNDETRIYALAFAGYEIKFTVAGSSLKVIAVE